MKSRRNAGRLALWITGIIGAILIASTVTWRYLKKDIREPNSKVEKVVEKNLDKVVKEASDSLYNFHYSDIDVNLEKGYAVISNLQISPNNAISKKLLFEQKLPNNIIEFKADKVLLKNIGMKKIEGEMAMHVGDMTVINPYMTINNKIRPHKNASEKSSWLSQISKQLFTSVDFDAIVDMKVDNMLLKNTTMIFVNNNGTAAKTTRLKNLDFIIKDFSTDALANKGSKEMRSVATIAHQRVVTADKLYYVDFRNIRIMPNEHKVYIGSFELLPTLSKAAFVKAVKAGKANYRYHLKATGISMNNMDLDKLSRQQQFHIPEVVVDYSWAEYYTNYKWPLRTPPNRRDKYPHELLQTLAFDVTIDKMQVKNGDMFFRIVTEGTGKEAFFSMNNIHSVYTNITNNSVAKKKNPYTTIESSYKVMNAGHMRSKYKLDLTDRKGGYTVSSTLGAMDGTAYNPLLEPLALMQVKSQKIEKMQLDMKVDEYKAVGNIDFYYKDYKVKLLKQGADSSLKNRSLVSFTSNVVIPNDNPRKNGKFRKGPINVIRDPQESFFGFQWRAMLDGLSSAMMGNDQDKEKPENKVTRMAKLFYGPDKGQEHKSTGGDKKRLANSKSDKKKAQ